MTASVTYTDRFGTTWTVLGSRNNGGWSLIFASRDLRLVITEPIRTPPKELSQPDLKELFCDAERLLENDGETWYVGYRRRESGRRSSMQGGLSTRFRSARGEVHYLRDMLDFRHMPASALQEHIAALNGGRRELTRAAPAPRRRAKKPKRQGRK